MDFTAVFREMGRNFRTDKSVRQMADFQCAADGIVIGDGDKVHSAFPGCAVKIQRGGVAFRDIELAHGPVGGFV